MLIAPVVEEILFRGILTNRWALKWGITTGIVASTVLFGMGHALGMIGATAFGLVAVLLYFQTGGLVVPITFHVVNNLVAVGLEFAFPSDEPWSVTAELEQIDTMLLPGLAMVAMTLPVLVWYIRANWPSRDAVLPYMAVASPQLSRDPGTQSVISDGS